MGVRLQAQMFYNWATETQLMKTKATKQHYLFDKHHAQWQS